MNHHNSHSATREGEYPREKVIGIQFGLMSPEEIRRSSVVEITSRDTYVNNRPVNNGLFDVKMGVLEPGYICKTDGLKNLETPGYHGHIELASPVFYIQHLPTIVKTLRCVCLKCSKLLVSKADFKEVWKLPPDQRWRLVTETLCKDVHRCGNETTDGCGKLQPTKIRKEGLAKIFAEWSQKKDGAKENLRVELTPELVHKIFKRIPDEDIAFMGFDPVFSRPEWMICHVFLVPPPAVRPSVKFDAQQRSEDDLTHILMQLLKNNDLLREKKQKRASDKTIEEYTMMVQYYAASAIDNQISGVASVAQRSGRPFKSIKDRMKGKTGRMRGNLMAKRNDYSARCVITADPNLSIEEVGVPEHIAKTVTVQETVNEYNRTKLTEMMMNGPSQYPGAKYVEKPNGQLIWLQRFQNRSKIVLETGDIVHRHMVNGDMVLFNRQPSLHRMSEQGHRVRVLRHGHTFRLPVPVTKPYNADFDGDEMNLHLPQTAEASIELKYLAAVRKNIISPGNNTAIIGIFQDSMVGSYLFSREGLSFSRRDAMRLTLAMHPLPEQWHKLVASKEITNMQLLSLLLPPLSMHYKTKAFKEGDDSRTSNAVVEIRNGEYLSGQIDKSVVGARSRGLIQRICNDFGPHAAVSFIDQLQYMITSYMMMASFSVGITDLAISSDDDFGQVMVKKRSDVEELFRQVQLGVLENHSGKSMCEELEMRVNGHLNQATAETAKMGLQKLNKQNRFGIQAVSGSKGSDLNITQMIACLGQQNVDGKRIPYGYDNRTLPHFPKFDDSPVARGFVESSYMRGLRPEELFFHTMAGRVGLIDTAVKTSTTGYIQRRLVKALEDLQVMYDMTVRTAKRQIVQFAYGDDGIDTIKVEDQSLPLTFMTRGQILQLFFLTEDEEKRANEFMDKETVTRWKKQRGTYTDRAMRMVERLLQQKDKLVANVYQFQNETSVAAPVAFQHVLNNVQGQCRITDHALTDLTPLEWLDLLETYMQRLQEAVVYAPPTPLFQLLMQFTLSPYSVLWQRRLSRPAALLLLETVLLQYKKALVAPGEMVGILAAQSLGEVSTQMTLNTFHFAGVASKSNVTRGVPRIEEILQLTDKIKNPSLSVFLRPEDETNQERARAIMYMLEHTRLRDLVHTAEVCFDPDDLASLIAEDEPLLRQYQAFERLVAQCGAKGWNQPVVTKQTASPMSKWIIRLTMNPDMLLEKNITMDDVYVALREQYGHQVQCIYSDYNAEQLIFRIRLQECLQKTSSAAASRTVGGSKEGLDQMDHILWLKEFQEQMMEQIVLRGIRGLHKVNMRKMVNNVAMLQPGVYEKRDIWVLDTVGTNLMEVLGLPYIDRKRTTSNDIMEVYHVLGMEAARKAIYNELVEVVEFDGTYINYHNYSLLVDRMTFSDKLISICRGGINNDDIGPIAKASFEETPEMFLKAARHGELDCMRGVSSNIMCGQEGYYGTSSFRLLVNLEEMHTLTAAKQQHIQHADEDVSLQVTDDWIQSSLVFEKRNQYFQKQDMGTMDDDYALAF